MRTFITKHTVYNFDELSEDGKQKALEKQREFIGEIWTGDYLIDDWKIRLEELGYGTVTIGYSGFWSQGDGASFTTSVIDLKKWLKSHKLSNKYRQLYNVADELSASVDRIDHHYSHWNTVRVNIYGEETDQEAQQREAVEELMLEEVQDLSRQIYQALQDAYEYETSDEQLIEDIKANEYEFYEDGRIA